MAIIVPIGVDTSGLTRGITQAQSGLRKFGRIAAIAAGAAALGAVVKTLQVGTAEFMEQQKVAAQTGAVLKSTGGIANVTAKQIGSLSTALMKKSGVDDEAIASGQNLLLTFTKIRNETGKGNDIFDQATVAMLDLSVAMGKDLNSSAILVGKALNDPVKGASALSRAGVQLTKGQKEQIEAFVDSGRVLEAQKIILGELTTQFGGSAEAAGKTLPGQLNILKQTFNNLAGELAATFLPRLATAATKLVGFLNKFTGAPTLQAKVEVITGSVEGAFARLKEWWNSGSRKELPAGVFLTPPGSEQVNTFIENLAIKLDAGLKKKGDQIGFALAEAIFGGAKRGAKQKGESAGNSIVANLFVNIPGFKLGIKLGESVIDGFERYFSEGGSDRAVGILESRFVEFIAKSIGLGGFFELGKAAADAFADGAEKAVKSGNLPNILTKQVKDAIQAARQSLAGAGTALGGSLATILGASITGPKGMKPAEVLAEERRIQDKRFEIEEARLKEAADATESTEEDKLALAEFYLNKEKTLRDRLIEEETAKRQGQINDLVELFNTGKRSAEQFETELNAIIGADRGSALGTAFVGAFGREIESIIKIAQEIQTVIGTGIDKQLIAGQGVGLVGTLSAENQRRFEEAKARHEDAIEKKKDQIAFNQKIIDDEKSSANEKKEARERLKLRRAELQKLLNNPPKRSTYGLALGGILKQPTFVAGEAGKEAVIPLQSGSAMRILRDAIGGGGGSTQNIYLTVHAGLGTNPDELSQVIVQSIKRYEKRNGAVFQGPLVTTAANATGKTDVTTGATTFNKIRTLRSG